MTISERTYAQFYWLARNIWAKTILFGMGFSPKVDWQQQMYRNQCYILVANHTSMLDIMLMLYVSKNPFVFVGKQELSKIPVFGFFYRRVCILVDRNDVKSRIAVYGRVRQRLKNGLSICIFPEGGIPDANIILDEFKNGAFRMAIKHTIPIIPMTFLDCKKRFPWTFFSGSPGILRVKVHHFIVITDLQTTTTSHLKNKVRKLIFNTLIADKMKLN